MNKKYADPKYWKSLVESILEFIDSLKGLGIELYNSGIQIYNLVMQVIDLVTKIIKIVKALIPRFKGIWFQLKKLFG